MANFGKWINKGKASEQSKQVSETKKKPITYKQLVEKVKQHQANKAKTT